VRLTPTRKQVTAVHKSCYLPLTDGIFLSACREVAARNGDVDYEEMLIDNCCAKLVSEPHIFDVIVVPNLYGAFVVNTATGPPPPPPLFCSKLCSNNSLGVASGCGVVPGANIGDNGAIFEQGCRRVAKDIAGRNFANPTAILLSAVLMLKLGGGAAPRHVYVRAINR
jgi:isocitrate dehydrogenase (NAD+)